MARSANALVPLMLISGVCNIVMALITRRSSLSSCSTRSAPLVRISGFWNFCFYFYVTLSPFRRSDHGTVQFQAATRQRLTEFAHQCAEEEPDSRRDRGIAAWRSGALTMSTCLPVGYVSISHKVRFQTLALISHRYRSRDTHVSTKFLP
jgi:hypothetical protein